jgi:SAM-dependent methyltransferase
MRSNDDLPRMYVEFANWFHLLSRPEEYETEADFYARVLIETSEVPVKSILELGSGGGNNAFHLKTRFDLTLVDLSLEMLELSRSLNPECEHIQGDMRTVRLGRLFDAVFVHDAVVYMTSTDELRAAMTSAFEHCEPGGVALFAPDHVTETFRPTTDHGGHDGLERGLRYLEWTWDPDPEDDTYVVDYAYLTRDEDGKVEVAHDRHVCGLFPRERWLQLLEDVGFRSHRRAGIEEETALDIFVGSRPR